MSVAAKEDFGIAFLSLLIIVTFIVAYRKTRW